MAHVAMASHKADEQVHVVSLWVDANPLTPSDPARVSVILSTHHPTDDASVSGELSGGNERQNWRAHGRTGVTSSAFVILP